MHATGGDVELPAISRRRFLSVALGTATAGGVLLAGGLLESCASTPVAKSTARRVSSRETPQIRVVDVSGVDPDEQLMLACLQGLANRMKPTVYLLGVAGGENSSEKADEVWLKDAVPLRAGESTVDDLLSLSSSAAKGLVIWDPSLAVHTQNVATTMAGALGALPVSPQLASKMGASPYGLPVLADLRDLHLKTSTAAYTWALQQMASKKLDVPGPPAWIGDIGDGTTVRSCLRDWIVAVGGFAFEIYPERSGELAFLTTMLESFPSHPAVFGYLYYDDKVYRESGIALNEYMSVRALSESNRSMVATNTAGNLSVYSRFTAPVQHPRWDETPRSPEGGKTYVALAVTDGDNVAYDLERMRVRYWDDPLRGTIPLGFSVSVWLPRLAPLAWEYYVRTMTDQECFVAGPSGAGYAYPSEIPDLQAYLALTNQMMSEAGLSGVWILDHNTLYPPSTPIVSAYVKALSPSIILAQYGGFPAAQASPPAVALVDGVPVAHAARATTVEGAVSAIEATAAAESPAGRTGAKFAFVALDAWTMSYQAAHEIMSRLGHGYEAVGLDTFAGMVKAAFR